MGQQKTFYLIDGSSYIYRAFYAIGRLTNSKGMPTQAVYGFNQMILKVLRDFPNGIQYHVHISGRTLQVPETALDACADQDALAQ